LGIENSKCRVPEIRKLGMFDELESGQSSGEKKVRKDGVRQIVRTIEGLIC
jgi:hypothetical protein